MYALVGLHPEITHPSDHYDYNTVHRSVHPAVMQSVDNTKDPVQTDKYFGKTDFLLNKACKSIDIIFPLLPNFLFIGS